MTATAKTSNKSRPMPTAPSTLERWFPIAVWLPKYKWGKYLTADLIAAISVAALLIPESMGYATVAGLPVQIGLYLAPLALIGYAMFGGSKVMVFAAAGSVAAITASILGALAGGDHHHRCDLHRRRVVAHGLDRQLHVQFCHGRLHLRHVVADHHWPVR